MTTTEHIIRNAVQCRRCWDIIESRDRWSLVRCSCGSVAIDGGHHCLNRMYKNYGQDSYIELSEFE